MNKITAEIMKATSASVNEKADKEELAAVLDEIVNAGNAGQYEIDWLTYLRPMVIVELRDRKFDVSSNNDSTGTAIAWF